MSSSHVCKHSPKLINEPSAKSQDVAVAPTASSQSKLSTEKPKNFQKKPLSSGAAPSEIGSETKSEPITFKTWTGLAIINAQSHKTTKHSQQKNASRPNDNNSVQTANSIPDKPLSDAPYGRAHYRLAASLGHSLGPSSAVKRDVSNKEDEKKDDNVPTANIAHEDVAAPNMRRHYG
jgi:hypothetical protein